MVFMKPTLKTKPIFSIISLLLSAGLWKMTALFPPLTPWQKILFQMWFSLMNWYPLWYPNSIQKRPMDMMASQLQCSSYVQRKLQNPSVWFSINAWTLGVSLLSGNLPMSNLFIKRTAGKRKPITVPSCSCQYVEKYLKKLSLTPCMLIWPPITSFRKTNQGLDQVIQRLINSWPSLLKYIKPLKP